MLKDIAYVIIHDNNLYNIIIVTVVISLLKCMCLLRSGKFSQNGKVHLGPNVSSSAHDRGCVVNGSGAMAAI